MTDEALDRIKRLEDQVALIETHFGRAFWHVLDKAYETTLPYRQLRCIVCDYMEVRDHFEIVNDRCMFGGGKLERYRCPKCDCIFGPQKYLDLDESFITSDYQLLYSNYSESDSTSNEIKTFESLSPRPGGLFLDWGCGRAWSKTITSLRHDGWNVWGYEPSVPATSGFIIKHRDEISSRFDGIFSNNVIEHFREPVVQFKEFHQILKDGGVMAHSSPCYDQSYTFSRFHTLFLLGRSPHVLAERTGFKVVDSVRDGEYINFVFSRI